MSKYEMVDGTESKASYLLLSRRNGTDISVKPAGMKDAKQVSGHTILALRLRAAPTPEHIKPSETVVELKWSKPVERPGDVLPNMKWDKSDNTRASGVLAIGIKGGTRSIDEVNSLIESLENPDLGRKLAEHVLGILEVGPQTLTLEQVSEWLSDFYSDTALDLREKIAVKNAMEEKVSESLGTVGLFSELLSKAYAASQGIKKKSSKSHPDCGDDDDLDTSDPDDDLEDGDDNDD